MAQNTEWIHANFKQLKEQYPGKYVAIEDENVIASGNTAQELLDQLEDRDLSQVRFMHVPETKAVFY